MIICLNCKSKNLDGALFCEECGAQLVNADSLVTQNIQVDEGRNVDISGNEKNTEAWQKFNAWASLHLVDSGHIFPLAECNEFTLGRTSGGQPIMPDIDLTPYQAYANGVSRLHAVLKREGKRTAIMDLGSSNGTYLNGRRLPPNLETPVSHGDIISLGKLKIQIMIRDIKNER